jgi:tetratricopeptide (TPR) repeat protein
MEAPATEFYRLTDAAGELARKDDYAGAALQWSKAIEVDPEDGKARYHLAYALDKQGQLEQSIEQYRKSVELDSSNAAAFASLSTALAHSGNLNGSIEAAKRALVLNPKDVLTEGNLAGEFTGDGTDGRSGRAHPQRVGAGSRFRGCAQHARYRPRPCRQAR